MVLLAATVAAFVALISGALYTAAYAPLGQGTELDELTGALHPVVIMPGTLSAQYTIEGLAAGVLLALGGAPPPPPQPRARPRRPSTR